MVHDIKLCIFDLDGVIVDTAGYHYQAWRELGLSFGFDLTIEQNEQLKGVSRVQSLNAILEWANVTKTAEEKELLAIQKNEDYIASIAKVEKVEALPGVVDFVKELKSAGIKTAIGSASKNAKLILERIGIINLFDAIVDGTMTTRGKPDPQVFQMGAEMTNCDPSNTIVFEDAVKGVDAALAAGMYAVGVGEEDQLGHAHKVIAGFEGMTLEDLKSNFDKNQGQNNS